MNADGDIQAIMEIVGCGTVEAAQYLDAANGSVEEAIILFFAAGENNPSRAGISSTSFSPSPDGGASSPSPITVLDEEIDYSFPGQVIPAVRPDVSGDAALAARLAREEESFFFRHTRTTVAGMEGDDLPPLPPHRSRREHENGFPPMHLAVGGEGGRRDRSAPGHPTPAVSPPNAVRSYPSVSFEKVCEEGRLRRLWVLVFFHDLSEKSRNAQKTLWEAKGLEMLNDMCLCYDVRTDYSGAQQLMQEYQLQHFCQPFSFMIVHPYTQHKVVEVPLLYFSKEGQLEEYFDAEPLITFVVGYLAEEGIPSFVGAGDHEAYASPPEEEEDRALGDGESTSMTRSERQEMENSRKVQSVAFLPEVEPFSPSESSPRTMEEASSMDGGYHSLGLTGSPSPLSTSSSAFPSSSSYITSLEAFEVLPEEEEGDPTPALKLRFQFPKSVLDVKLRKDTPFKSLLEYCAYRMHRENREAFPAPPAKPFLLIGFPPRRVDMTSATSEDMTLGACPQLRSGDKVVVKAC